MSLRIHHYFFLVLFFLSCEGPVFDVPADEDSIPPTLTITFPADQSVLSDTVLITAYAFDNVELEMVTLYLNDSVVHESKEGPYEYSWATINDTEDEHHTIRAKAQDLSGNVNYTNTIQVLVNNQDNINKYTKTVQKNSFLDVSYERLVNISQPKIFLKTTNLILENSFPISNLYVDKNKPICVYNYYQLILEAIY